MFEIKNFEPREYQKSLFESAKKANSLVCLPTGTGKTKIAIMSALHRLNENINSKVLICSPTKPLTNQICEEFKSSTTITPSLINTLTGAIKPEVRKKLWNVSKVVVATPQTVENDLKNNLISLKDVSLLVIDECHHSKMKFANTTLAKNYIEQGLNQRILALTASPGATKDKINEICENLFIKNVEMKTEYDEDVTPYIQQRDIEFVTVELPEEIKHIHSFLKESYRERVNNLKKFGLTKPASIVNKKDIILFQKHLQSTLRESRSYASFWGISLTAQALKLSHAMELLETQSLNALNRFLEKLNSDTSKAAKSVLKEEKIQTVIELTKDLVNKKFIHPKIQKISEIVRDELNNNERKKIIIFANYRDTVDELVESLKSIEKAKPAKLVGHKEGFSQKDQIATVKKFSEGIYNILIGTSIMEEGLDIVSCDLSIFYDMVPSEIRTIQRRGRVGRITPGKIIMLIAKGTRDEAFRWTAHRKEKMMHSVIKNIKEKHERQNLLD